MSFTYITSRDNEEYGYGRIEAIGSLFSVPMCHTDHKIMIILIQGMQSLMRLIVTPSAVRIGGPEASGGS